MQASSRTHVNRRALLYLLLDVVDLPSHRDLSRGRRGQLSNIRVESGKKNRRTAAVSIARVPIRS